LSYFNLTLFLCCFVVDLLMLMLLYSYDVCWWSSYVVHLSLLILLYACYFYLWFIDLLTLISSTWSSHARPQRVFLLAGGGQISSAMSRHIYILLAGHSLRAQRYSQIFLDHTLKHLTNNSLPILDFTLKLFATTNYLQLIILNMVTPDVLVILYS